jgi:phosphatidate cytidylyltransferase
MLKTRVATALLLLFVFVLALFFFPDRWWAGITLLVAAAGAFEWAKLARLSSTGCYAFVITTVGLGLVLLLSPARQASPFFTVIYVLSALFWTVLAPAWLRGKWRVAHPLALLLAGWAVLLPCWLALIELREAGAVLLLWIMGIVWITDTAAYLAGRRFGRHKLAPQVSPGKTWEGLAGAIAAVTFYAFAGKAAHVPEGIMGLAPVNAAWALLLFVVLHWALACYSVLGDLFESWVKRMAGVKDSGSLLPGHGGVLDRIDSLTSTLPLAALFYAIHA